jgi:hypothetical protein
MHERPDIELIAARHHDPAAVPAWAVGQVTPLDELMAKEEEGEAEPMSFSRMFRLVLVFCFSDAQAGGWEMPVWRALAITRSFFAGDLVGAQVRPVEVFCRPVFSLAAVAEMLVAMAGGNPDGN